MTVAVPNQASYTRADWCMGYESLKTEHSYWIDDIDGRLPPDLVGTLFRNGPGQLDVNGCPYSHPFDGDGMVSAITFTGDRAHFQNRYVRTPEFEAEQKAGRILYRGVFGTPKPGGWLANVFDLRTKNLANTNVVYQGDKLLALWEASAPYSLSPDTLATLGEETFDGALASGQSFTAHPRRDPETGDLIAFGVKPGLSSTIYLYRVDDRGQLVEQTSHQVPGFCFLHDFVITPNYRIFFQNPVSFNALPFVFGLKSAGSCVVLDPKAKTQILLFDRQGNLHRLETDPCFIFHHVNAYEADANTLVVESICYEDYPSLESGRDFRDVNFAKVPPAFVYRFTLDLKRDRVSKKLIFERSCEFPTVHPDKVGHEHRYTYLGSIASGDRNAPLQAITKIDGVSGETESHSFAPRGFISEPLFIPRPEGRAEDDGWVVTVIFDAAHNRSDVVILDAQNIADAPVATLHLKHHIPYGLHGSFTTEVFGDRQRDSDT